MGTSAEAKLAFLIELPSFWVIKRLKDYVTDAGGCEGDRPLGGAVGLLRQRSGPRPEEQNNKPEQRDP